MKISEKSKIFIISICDKLAESLLKVYPIFASQLHFFVINVLESIFIVCNLCLTHLVHIYVHDGSDV